MDNLFETTRRQSIEIANQPRLLPSHQMTTKFGNHCLLPLITQSVNGNCRFEEIAISDLFAAIESNGCRKRTGCLVVQPSKGPHLLLKCAMKEIESARAASAASDQKRLCSNAILNAQRSLACLVDWCVIRDLRHLCKSPPKNAEEKVVFF